MMEDLVLGVSGWSFLLLVVVITLLYIYSTWTYNTFKKLGIPGPKPWPLVGNIEMIPGYCTFAWHLKKKYGNVVGIYAGRQPVIFLFDPKLIKQVMIKDFDHFANHSPSNFPTFDPPLEKSLLMLEGNKWKHVRKLMTPAFTSGKLRRMSSQINASADILVEKLNEFPEASVELSKLTSRFSLDVISRVAFGIETNAQTNSKDPVFQSLQDVLEVNTVMAMLTFFFGDLFNLLRRKFGLRPFMGTAIDFFAKLTKQLIEQRKSYATETEDLLQLLLDTRTEKSPRHVASEANANVILTDKDLIAHIMTFYIGGTETTGKTLTFLCHCLAFSPELQDRLTKGIDNVVGSSKNVTPDLCAKVPYLKQCIFETLRLYPPFRKNTRLCTRTTYIEGIHFPADIAVEIPVAVLHMDPEYWNDPERFNPDRFSHEEQAIRDPILWQPFGAGPRNCIGMRLALMELEIATVKLLQNFRFLPGPGSVRNIKMKDIVVSDPVKPVVLRLQKR